MFMGVCVPLLGAERLSPDCRRESDQAPSAAREKVNDLRALLRRNSLGGRFEDKANGVEMHWRGASPRQAKLIEQKVSAAFEPLAQMDGLRLLEFDAGLELRVGRDKGGAVETIEREASPGAPVAFRGDDSTDEAAFRTLNCAGLRGMSVLMRRQWCETEANVWLRPPGELREFLEQWRLTCRTQS